MAESKTGRSTADRSGSLAGLNFGAFFVGIVTTVTGFGVLFVAMVFVGILAWGAIGLAVLWAAWDGAGMSFFASLLLGAGSMLAASKFLAYEPWGYETPEWWSFASIAIVAASTVVLVQGLRFCGWLRKGAVAH